MNRPTGVTLIAVLYFIGGGFAALAGVLMVAGGGMLATIMSQQGAQAGPLAGMMAGLGAALGIIILAVAALDIVLGVGLIKLKEWARLTSIILTGIGAAFQVLGIISIVTHFNVVAVIFRAFVLAIQVIIIAYLLKPEVKAAFQGAQARGASA